MHHDYEYLRGPCAGLVLLGQRGDGPYLAEDFVWETAAEEDCSRLFAVYETVLEARVGEYGSVSFAVGGSQWRNAIYWGGSWSRRCLGLRSR